MAEITFNLELNSRPDKQGRYSIFIRITENKKSRKVKTSIELSSKADWNKKKQCVRSSEQNATLWNNILDKELEKARQTCRDLKDAGIVSKDAVQRKLKQSSEDSLLEYSRSVHQALFKEGRLGSWKKYGSFISKLEEFLAYNKTEDIPLCAVNVELVKNFTQWLQGLENSRYKANAGNKSSKSEQVRLSPNTIIKLQRIFRAILNKAQLEGFVNPDSNPFKVYKVEAEKPVIKVKLNGEELDLIEALDLPEGCHMWHARNAFFLSYYCAGIRASDLIQLQWANITPEGRLHYQMGKNHKVKDIKLVAQAQEILEKYKIEGLKDSDYIFPYLDSRAKYAKYIDQSQKDIMPLDLKKSMFETINAREVQINKQLNKIARLAGIERHISFHISRHTFAKSAKLAGTDNALLEGLMNHSSLAITERYMKDFDTSGEDQALEQIFSDRQKAKASREAELLMILKGMDKEALVQLLNKVNDQ